MKGENSSVGGYQTRTPGSVIDSPYTGKPARTLEPGENGYAYVAGLRDKSAPTLPLVVDGTDGTGHHTTDAKQRGGLWGGNRAVVIHLDNSGAVETPAGPNHARCIPQREGMSEQDRGNQLDVAGLGVGVRLLDPAVGSR